MTSAGLSAAMVTTWRSTSLELFNIRITKRCSSLPVSQPLLSPRRRLKQYFVDPPHENFGRIGANLGGGVAVAGLAVGLFSTGRIARGDTFRAASYDLSEAIIV